MLPLGHGKTWVIIIYFEYFVQVLVGFSIYLVIDKNRLFRDSDRLLIVSRPLTVYGR